MPTVSGSQRRFFGTKPRALVPCNWSSATLSRQTLKTLCWLSRDGRVTDTTRWKDQSFGICLNAKMGRKQMKKPGPVRGDGHLDLKHLLLALLGDPAGHWPL